MSRFIGYILGAFALLMAGNSLGQSVTELIKFGDMAYDNGNYASAAYFYEMVVDAGKKAERNSTYPYEMMAYTGAAKKVRKNKEEDSTAVQFEQQPEEDAGKISKMEMYASHLIAECYRLINDYEKAEQWYVQSLQYSWGEMDEYIRDRFWYAVILINNSKYQQASEELAVYLLDGKDTSKYFMDKANTLIEGCKFAQSADSKGTGISVSKTDSILNKGNGAYALSYFGQNTFLFSSSREGSTGDAENKDGGFFLSDVYSTRKSGSSWAETMPLEGQVNTPAHEGGTSVTEDKTSMYFTRWSSNEKNAEVAIHISKFFVDKWMNPKKLNEYVNANGFKSMHPFVTKKGTHLFFASDMPGGQGGMDIWVCEVDWQGKASKAVNLGPAVNGPGDEVTPFYHEATQTLYFSSDGHKGIGGFDIFKAAYTIGETAKGTPVNMGFPVNSARNDKYFIMDDLQTSGYLTSNRENCKGCATANCNEIYAFVKSANDFALSGVVYDAATNQPLANSKITVKDVQSVFAPFYIETDSLGRYTLPLEPEMHIFIKAQKLEYFADANVVSTIGVSDSKSFTQDFHLSIIPYEEIVIKGIEYDYDKATLRAESKTVLDEMVEFLKLNDNIIIEISSHTDDRASDKYNMSLSQNRAEAVVKYLIDQGISKDRLLAKGYGETVPLVKNAATEEDHQRNRRTTFRTLSEKYEPIEKYRPKR